MNIEIRPNRKLCNSLRLTQLGCKLIEELLGSRVMLVQPDTQTYACINT